MGFDIAIDVYRSNRKNNNLIILFIVNFEYSIASNMVHYIHMSSSGISSETSKAVALAMPPENRCIEITWQLMWRVF